VPLFTQKSMAEKAENEQAKLQMKRIKMAQMATDLDMKAMKEKMRNTEIARLRA
jgi:hypothetical protein